MRVFFANLKSHMTPQEGKQWLDSFVLLKLPENKQVIVCPPFTLLTIFKDSGLSLCAQNISPYPQGSYTGEISAGMLKDLAGFVLIGHSERKKYFKETTEDISNKLIQAQNNNLIPLLCISGETEIDSYLNLAREFEKIFILYEPTFAIGTGNPDTPQNASSICEKIKSKLPSCYFLYGGSVSKDNIRQFSEKNCIDGVIVGKNSLDPEHFFEIVKNG